MARSPGRGAQGLVRGIVAGMQEMISMTLGTLGWVADMALPATMAALPPLEHRTPRGAR